MNIDAPQHDEPALALIVDDEPSICWGLQEMLQREGHRVLTASNAEDGLRIAADESPDIVMLDVRLPGMDGLTALPQFCEATGNAPVVMMTAFGDLQTAVQAVQNGAFDYLTKPFELDAARATCQKAIHVARASQELAASEAHQAHENNEEGAAGATGATGDNGESPAAEMPDHIVGHSLPMQQVFRLIAMVADSDLSVLITGETGTGKELVAAAIHRHSRRNQGPYVAVAPVTFNPELLESELFGHVHGAFTGATQDRAGVFETADGGTLFLDELADLPMSTQTKLLRVLETGQYARVGETTTHRANVRLIAATNIDLQRAVDEGRFRKDLFYRLNNVQVHLPPLRQRLEDLEALVLHFLRRCRHPHPQSAYDDAFIEQLRHRPWHGNVRELRNAIERAAVLARGRALSISDMPPPMDLHNSHAEGGTAEGADLDVVFEQWFRVAISQSETDLYERFLQKLEPSLFRLLLEHTGGNRAKAAEILGMHRGTLRERLKTRGID